MRRAMVRSVLLAGGLMVASDAIQAQVYRYPNDRAYRWDDRHGPETRYGYGAHPAAVVQRVIRDLRGAYRYSYYTDRHEREHFERAVSELQKFQDRWSRRGRAETGYLDRAIDHMKHLAGARQVDRRARRVIDQDIEILRDLRAELRWRRD